MAKPKSVFSTKKTSVKKPDNSVWTQMQNRFAPSPSIQREKNLRNKLIAKEIATFHLNGKISSLAEIMQAYGRDDKQARSIRESVRRKLDLIKVASEKRKSMIDSFKVQADQQAQSRSIDQPDLPESEIAFTEEIEIVEVDVRPLRHDDDVASIVLKRMRLQYRDEILVKGEQTSAKEGFIYLVEHPMFEGWVKAGMAFDYELRIATYNVSDPLSRFKLTRVKWVPHRRNAEKELLEAMSLVSTMSQGEWFKIDSEAAYSVFLSIKS